MFALDAVKHLMGLVLVLECRRLKALTPHYLDIWECKLQEAGLTGKYLHVVAGLHYGFSISFPQIISTQIPPNKHSIIEFTEEFSRIIGNEIQKECYIGLISQQDVKSLIGPFQTSPFSIIPKPGRPDIY